MAEPVQFDGKCPLCSGDVVFKQNPKSALLSWKCRNNECPIAWATMTGKASRDFVAMSAGTPETEPKEPANDVAEVPPSGDDKQEPAAEPKREPERRGIFGRRRARRAARAELGEHEGR